MWENYHVTEFNWKSFDQINADGKTKFCLNSKINLTL